MTTVDPKLNAATIGIITALPEEYAAVKAVFDCGPEIPFPGGGAARTFAVAQIPALHQGDHHVAVTLLSGAGNDIAAISSMRMRQCCPNVNQIIMVGVAGAIPCPTNANNHVRLGDIVYSNGAGVIKYDMVRQEPGKTTYRPPPRPPSPQLLEAARRLQASEHAGKYPWDKYIDACCKGQNGSNWRRPPTSTDKLHDSQNGLPPTKHPRDPKRRKRTHRPRVFDGPICSADTLLKDPVLRDKLRDQFGARCVEMEGSGVSNATWILEDAEYFIVRGGCDYCNPGKNDIWHNYAALVAAAYTRALLEELPLIALSLASPNQLAELQLNLSVAEYPTVTKPVVRIETDTDVTTNVTSVLPPELVKLVEQHLARILPERSASAPQFTSVPASNLTQSTQLGTDSPSLSTPAPASTVHVRSAAQCASDGIVISTQVSAVQSELVNRDARAYVEEIQLLIDTCETERAIAQGDVFERWLEEHECELTPLVGVDAYKLLVIVEELRARSSSMNGESWDTTRARVYLEKAKKCLK